MGFDLPLRWLFGALLGFGLVASACSGSDAGDELLPTLTTAESVETTVTTEPEPEVEDPLVGATEEDLAALWQEMWEATALPADDRAAAVEALGGALDSEVAVGVPQMMPDSIERDVRTFPVFDGLNTDGQMEIRDCILYVPEALQAVGHVHIGTASPDGEGGWVIDAIQRVSRGCIPAELNSEVVDAYQAFRAAQAEYLDPATPGHPGIETFHTGESLEAVNEAVGSAAERGLGLKRNVEFRPEVVRMFADDRIEIQDCVEVDPDGGVFDADGNRAEGTSAPIEGQRDRYDITMTLEDGQWKVESSFIQFADGCLFAPTPSALEVVGPEGGL